MRTEPTVKVVCGRVDAVPLVDIVFLLMIFFLISSSLVFQPGIPVELPQVRTSAMRGAEKIIVTITRNDQLFFNDNRVEWQELERELRELVLSSRTLMDKSAAGQSAEDGPLVRSPMLVLRADAGVTYSRIVEVMSLARSLNLGVYLATDVQQPGGNGTARASNDR